MSYLYRILCSFSIGILLAGCASFANGGAMRLERISVLSDFDKGLLRQYFYDPGDIDSFRAKANAEATLRRREWFRIDISTTDDWVKLGPRGGNVVEPVAYICSGPNEGEYLIPRGIIDASGIDLNLAGDVASDLPDDKVNITQYYAIFLTVDGYDSPIAGASRRYFSGGKINADVCIRVKFSAMFGSTLSRELVIPKDKFLPPTE